MQSFCDCKWFEIIHRIVKINLEKNKSNLDFAVLKQRISKLKQRFNFLKLRIS